MGLNNLGLHKLESYKTLEKFYLNSFFIQRDYLNYIIFPPGHVSLFKDFFEAKGGVGKQLLTNKEQINLGCEQTFSLFGASVVLLSGETLDFDPKLKIEHYGESYFEKDLIEVPFKSVNLGWFRFYQQGKYFLVTDEKLIQTVDGWLRNPSYPLTVEQENFLKHYEFDESFKVDYLVPRCHVGEFYLQRISNGLGLQAELKKYISRGK